MTRETGDVRYRPDITGYNQRRRGRLRQTQHQIALLVTATVRDNGSAASILRTDGLQHAIKEAAHLYRLQCAGTVARSDARAAFVNLAAVATIWAESLDCPPEIVGPRAEGTHAHDAVSAGAVEPYRSLSRALASLTGDAHPDDALSTEERRVRVAELRSRGRSQRAIASELGVAKRTVEKDLRRVAAGSQPDNVVGLDGRRYRARRVERLEDAA